MSNVCSIVLVGSETLPNAVLEVIFQTVSFWIQQKKNVWLFSHEPISVLPTNCQLPYNEDLLNCLTLFYVPDAVRLLEQFNVVHERDHLPQLIIVKNFEKFLLKANGTALERRKTAFVAAALSDFVRCCSRKPYDRPVMLLVHIDSLIEQFLIDLYFYDDSFRLNGENTRAASDFFIQKLHGFISKC